LVETRENVILARSNPDLEEATLARLSIPPVFRPALNKLGSLSDKSVDDLVIALRGTVPVLNPKRLASKLAVAPQSIPADDLVEIIGALIALSAVRIVNQVPVPEFVEEVCRSLEAGKATAKEKAPSEKAPSHEGVETAAQRLERLRGRLSALLEAPPLILAAKASTLQREHTNILMSTRVITDIRPVFLDEPDSAQGAMIVHVLKLSYFHDSEPTEIFVAMDYDDLNDLERTITRAKAKSKTIRDIIAKADLTDLES
jgi:hypothetical protein